VVFIGTVIYDYNLPRTKETRMSKNFTNPSYQGEVIAGYGSSVYVPRKVTEMTMAELDQMIERVVRRVVSTPTPKPDTEPEQSFELPSHPRVTLLSEEQVGWATGTPPGAPPT
jgi:hypothetical protein